MPLSNAPASIESARSVLQQQKVLFITLPTLATELEQDVISRSGFVQYIESQGSPRLKKALRRVSVLGNVNRDIDGVSGSGTILTLGYLQWKQQANFIDGLWGPESRECAKREYCNCHGAPQLKALSTEVVKEEPVVYESVTTAQAVEYERMGRVFDENNNRIIYKITDTASFSNPLSYNPENREKTHIAFHGTGFDEETHGEVSDFMVSKSALYTLQQSADAAFMIGASGAAYQFFDPNLGFGALNGELVQRAGYSEHLNRDTIAIELALREDNTAGFGVERPNQQQVEAGVALVKYLKKSIASLSRGDVISSRDPLQYMPGFGHLDDFCPEDRVKLGIAPVESAAASLKGWSPGEVRFT